METDVRALAHQMIVRVSCPRDLSEIRIDKNFSSCGTTANTLYLHIVIRAPDPFRAHKYTYIPVRKYKVRLQ